SPGSHGVKCLPHYGMGMVAMVVVGTPTNLEEAKAAPQVGKAKQVMAGLFEKLMLAKTAANEPIIRKEAVMSARNYDGWPLFSYGFRPFFLLGSLYAGVAILVWLPVFMGELSLVSAFMPRDWHVHEMLYGFLPAVITGFLFTAIPNWTGRLPLRGRPLMFLVALWALGRACVTFSAYTGWLPAMLIDTRLPLLVAAPAPRDVIARTEWDN